MLKRKESDWRGEPITEPESPETIIKVWIITPGDRGFDEIWIRSYPSAVAFAQQRIYDLADGGGDDELKEGVSVTMKVREVTLEEYLEAQEAES